MRATDEREKALRDRASEPLPESWVPEKPGDEIVGVFRRLDKGSTAYGDAWIVVLESHTEPGKLVSVWLFHQALRNEFARAKPVDGELLLVKYEGKKPVKHPQPGRSASYDAWRVVVDRPAGAFQFDWNQVGDGGGGDGATAAVDHESDVPF